MVNRMMRNIHCLLGKDPFMDDELDPQRINGFAPGDRVGITAGPYKGAYGKVHESWGGCRPSHCLTQCHLVWVDLMSTPGNDLRTDLQELRYTYDDARYRYQTYGESNRFRFPVNEVTHVD